jgi:hypothetical protein
MRRDEIAAREEQKKHLIAEFRSLASRYDDGKAWGSDDPARREYLTRVQPFERWEEIEAIAEELDPALRPFLSSRQAPVCGKRSGSCSIGATSTGERAWSPSSGSTRRGA